MTAYEQELEDAQERYYAQLDAQRRYQAKRERYSATAKQTIKIAKKKGIQADDDMFDLVDTILEKLGQHEAFLQLEE